MCLAFKSSRLEFKIRREVATKSVIEIRYTERAEERKEEKERRDPRNHFN